MAVCVPFPICEEVFYLTPPRKSGGGRTFFLFFENGEKFKCRGEFDKNANGLLSFFP